MREYDTRSTRIRDAADRAHQLIAYLSSIGTTVPDEDMDAVGAIAGIVSSPDVDPETEHEFWAAYARVSRLLPEGLDPAGVYYSSLYDLGVDAKASEQVQEVRRKIVISMRFFTWFTTAVLVILVLLLAYGAILDSGAKRMNDLLTERIALLSNDWSETRFLPPEGDPCSFDDTDTDWRCSEYDLAVFDDIEGVAVRLDDWLPGKLIETSVLQLLLQNTQQQSRNGFDISDPNRIQIAVTEMLGLLNSYVYPLLAGVLGALLALLRSIYSAVEARTLNLRMFSTAYLRIAMGAVAGIVVGWVGVESVTGLSVTSLAIAFAAGYAVEIVFSALDRIVGAFAQPPEPPANQPRPTGGGSPTP